MFEAEGLNSHLESSPTISSSALILAEWNMNSPDNIKVVGNYRHRGQVTSAWELGPALPSVDVLSSNYTTTVSDIENGRPYRIYAATGTLQSISSMTGATPTMYSGYADFFGGLSESKISGVATMNGTYSTASGYVTVTRAGHGLSESQAVTATFTSGGATSGSFVISSVTANTFKFPIGTMSALSGNVTITFTPRLRVFKKFANVLPDTFDLFDKANAYTDATDADVEIEGPYDSSGEPRIFLSSKEKTKLLYSLDDCFKPHRPRSGINYMSFIARKRFFDGRNNTSERPRYYMGSYGCPFKYWTSYRTEAGKTYGLSKARNSAGVSFIDDVAPFVVYEEKVPANKIVIKMQTHVGTEDKGDIRTPAGVISDPLYGHSNSCTPNAWDIQVLVGSSWVTVKSFHESSTRTDGSPVIDSSGYVELFYGLSIPEKYTDTDYVAELPNISLLPKKALQGEYYLVVADDQSLGSVYIWWDGAWEYFTPEYSWQLVENYDPTRRRFVPDLTDPSRYTLTGSSQYRDFQYVDGLRVVVKTMNRPGVPFDLIELSPRLVVDVTERTLSLSATKSIGYVDETALPVGGLEAGTGEIELFDDDLAFNENNSESIVSDHITDNIAFSIYDVVKDVDSENGNQAFFIPVKTMYTESVAPSYQNQGTVSWRLRDMFYYFESQPAPAVSLNNVSLSVAVTMLLDHIGFSNYTFKRTATSKEPILPNFFVSPDQNVAEVLEKLAVATQTAMFFDEYNNFVVMYRDYMLPHETARDTDIVFSGDSSSSNIVDISSQEKKIFNSGTISYTERYVQRSVGSLRQANFVNNDQNWIYLPALLWEVSGTDSIRTVNSKTEQQSSYALSAMPLKSDLSSALPRVSGGTVINNTMDFGENVYWLARNQGYLYANGEIIRFDAIEYSVTMGGTTKAVWISNNSEYQEYMGRLSFNGKMFPTGLVRIYAEPFYHSNGSMVNGAVKSHGRGSFNTEVTEHFAGAPSEWTSDSSTYGVKTASSYIFDGTTLPASTLGKSETYASDQAISRATSKSSIIKNFLRDIQYSESQIAGMTTTRAGTIQSSALSVRGPRPGMFTSTTTARDFLSLSAKKLENSYRHFGTRMRIIGKIEASSDNEQDPLGGYPVTASNGSTQILKGGSGGIFFGVNSDTLNGYYLELIALTNASVDALSGDDDSAVAHNVLFYKLAKQDGGAKAMLPIKLWGGTTNVVVDDGTFVGQGRNSTEDISTVNDISIEWAPRGNGRRFFVYLNDKEIAVVDDEAPLPMGDTAGVFVRGSSYCMFENFFAITRNVSDYGDFTVVANGSASEAFGADKVTANQLNKYALSGIVRKSFLSGVGVGTPNTYRMYYEEFGTIMREASYFDIRYDKAYPALWSQVSPTFNNVQGYTVSGYTADAYGAKFLVFNATDKALSLDETTGNYLRIQGVAFTQDTTYDLTMDDYLNLISDTSNVNDPYSLSISTTKSKDIFKDIRINRTKYGKKEFSLSSDYIQTQADARNLMGWLVDKSIRPRLQVGLEIFHNPTVQLGDIFSIQYTIDGVDKIAPADKQFVVYNIEYSYEDSGPKMVVYGSEI
jgi:hypothetical protein